MRWLSIAKPWTRPGFVWAVAGLLLLVGVAMVPLWTALAAPSAADPDFRADWSVRDGFDISVDAVGFNLPTSIAFVPNPGPNAKDPLYFVSEIQGQIKVVTNDRTVFTFADDVFGTGPAYQGYPEGGLDGICLDPEHGYLFATFIRLDQNDLLRNNIIRFQSTPETFSLEATSRIEIDDFLMPFPSSLEHPIGSCLVEDSLLYVSIGDASKPQQSQQLDSTVGKVVRMTLDGQPAPGNPFNRDDDPTKAETYILR